MCDKSKSDTNSDCITLCKCACYYCKSCKKVVCKCETNKCPEELASCFKVECICGEECICCDEKSGKGRSCLCGEACPCCTKEKSKCCSLSDCVVLCQCICYFCKSCKKVICKCDSYKCLKTAPSKEASSNTTEDKCVICDEKSECGGNSACEDSCHCIKSDESNTNCIPLCKCALFYNKASKKMFCKCENSKCSEESTCSSGKADCGESKCTPNPNWIPLCKCTGYYCKSCKKIVCKCETFTCPEELSSIDKSSCGEKCMC